MENDADGSAQVQSIFAILGRFHHLELLPKLLTMMDEKSWRRAALSAALETVGYDQPLHNRWDEDPAHEAEKKQRPRSHEGLAAILGRLYDLGEVKALLPLVDAARWAPSSVVEPLLVTLSRVVDEALRRESVKALAWRAKHREGQVDALREVLGHKDSLTAIYAADGLAQVGVNDGAAILLTALDTVDDLQIRESAVLSLGLLAEARALDKLLGYANDPLHALHEASLEALGHMGRNDKNEVIFKLLERILRKEADRNHPGN